MKTLKVQKIESGTVIDHIEAGSAWKVVKILGLEEYPGTVLVLSNIESKSFKKKDIIKVEKKELGKNEVDKISLVSPKATVNIIENYEIKKKYVVNIPDTVEGILKCTNPNCITNNESIRTRFSVESKNPLKIRCYFCERIQRGLEFNE